VETFTGDHGNSRIELSFRVRCPENYHGVNCTSLCVETEGCEDILTCPRGWSDPANGCRTRELAYKKSQALNLHGVCAMGRGSSFIVLKFSFLHAQCTMKNGCVYSIEQWKVGLF
jgi:hypothetical protein